MIHDDETTLPDDYPVYPGYVYLIEFEDGAVFPWRSDGRGTVGTFRERAAAALPGRTIRHVRRCNLLKRFHL